MQSISTRPTNPIITYRVTHGAASQKYVADADGVDAGGVDAGGVDAGALFGVYVYIMPPSTAPEACVDVETRRFLPSREFWW